MTNANFVMTSSTITTEKVIDAGLLWKDEHRNIAL
jgi:hypothetical protein